MEKIFRHTFQQKVWSIGYFTYHSSNYLWIETQNENSSEWHLLSLSDQKISQIPTPQKSLTWITSLEQIGVFCQIKSGKNPGIQGIEAYDLLTGDLRYRIDCQHWLEIKGFNILISHDQKSFWIDLRNGKMVKEESVDFDSISHVPKATNPQHYEENQEYFKDFQLFFQQKFQENISKGIDYWEGKEKLIFSYYIYHQGWKNYLKICDLDFHVTHVELISEGDLIGYNTFQIIENQIVYVTNKQQIVVYEY
ncbi:hypothetical protein V7S76_03180 [Aquirufa sp. ROCK2-A2]